MYCTLRTHNENTAEYVLDKIKKIINSVAEISGGTAEYIQGKHYPIVMNNELIMKKLEESALKVVGEENIKPRLARGMGGEDFAYFAKVKPGGMYRLGIRNIEKGCTAGLHNSKFMIDEAALKVGSDIFVQFVLDNMNGIDFN